MMANVQHSKIAIPPPHRFVQLQQVSLPVILTIAGDVLFASCVALTNNVLPARVEAMGLGIFFQCTSLNSVTHPASLRNVEDHCFFLAVRNSQKLFSLLVTCKAEC